MSKKNGFSFIDILVGMAIMLIVFLGIFGAYQLGIKALGQSRNKIVATAVLNQQIELIKNMPYESVGVKDSFPDGVLESSTTTIQNGIEYTIIRRVDFVLDQVDGLAPPADECPNDYKKVEIRVSWLGRFSGEIMMVTDIAPKTLSQECAISGGILSVAVFDASGTMVNSPLIEVKDPLTDEVLKTATPPDGQTYFSLATSTYKVVVSKANYSSERTYGTNEVASPEKPHPIILEDQVTEISFSIDRVGNFSIDTLSPWGQGFFTDSFLNISKVDESSDVELISGEVRLASTTDDEGYSSSGYLISVAITPASMLRWDEFIFTDSEPADTDLKYQIYYASSTNWLLIPDNDLTGNSLGLDDSGVDLSGLNINKYASLKIKANFSTAVTSTTPVLEDWQVSWITSQATPIPNKTFILRGAKIIGTDADENPIYKYSQNHISDGGGHIDLNNLEWDAYTFSLPVNGLDLSDISPSPQPVNLLPTNSMPVKLYLDAEDSVLINLQDEVTLSPILGASVRLSNVGLGYNATQYTDINGQTYFIPLSTATYQMEIQATGYAVSSSAIAISGDIIKTVHLTPLEE